MTEGKKSTLTTDLEIELLEQVNTLQVRGKALEDALAGARVFVSMDTLPDNVHDEGQRQGAIDLLEVIDALILIVEEEHSHDCSVIFNSECSCGLDKRIDRAEGKEPNAMINAEPCPQHPRGSTSLR